MTDEEKAKAVDTLFNNIKAVINIHSKLLDYPSDVIYSSLMYTLISFTDAVDRPLHLMLDDLKKVHEDYLESITKD